MTDTKELRRLAGVATIKEWEYLGARYDDFGARHFIVSDIKTGEEVIGEYGTSEEFAKFIALANPSAILSLLDKIDAQEKEIAELHTSIAGAVQHGEQGWQRYEAANKMCLNQQNEIAGLNEAIAELRKDAERYQWLKNRYSDDGLYIAIESGAPGEPPYSINGTYADREIDAAIAQQDKKKD